MGQFKQHYIQQKGWGMFGDQFKKRTLTIEEKNRRIEQKKLKKKRLRGKKGK